SRRQREVCRGGVRLLAVRLLERPRPAAAGVLRIGGGAVSGAAVRPDADRGLRGHRSLDSTGARRPPVPETVVSISEATRSSGNGRAVVAVAVGLLATATMPVAILATRYSGRYELLHAGFAIPVAVALGILSIWLASGALRHDDARLGRAGGR